MVTATSQAYCASAPTASDGRWLRSTLPRQRIRTGGVLPERVIRYSIRPPVSNAVGDRKQTPPELMSLVFSVRSTRLSPRWTICRGSCNRYRCARRCSNNLTLVGKRLIINRYRYVYSRPAAGLRPDLQPIQSGKGYMRRPGSLRTVRAIQPERRDGQPVPESASHDFRECSV